MTVFYLFKAIFMPFITLIKLSYPTQLMKRTKTTIIERRRVKADLHNHFRTSSNMDGLFDPAVNTIFRNLGIYSLIGLINFEDQRYEKFIQQPGYERQDLGNSIYLPKLDILIVKGQEVPTQQGHLLVLGIEKGKKNHIPVGMSLKDTIKASRDLNGIIIADHPFYRDGIGPFLQKKPGYLSRVDAFETHNGEAALWIPGLTPKDANQKALEFYQRTSTSKLVGSLACSDGHSLYEIGSSYTDLTMPDYSLLKCSEDVSSSLKKAVKNATSSNRHTNDSRISTLCHIISLGLIKLGLLK